MPHPIMPTPLHSQHHHQQQQQPSPFLNDKRSPSNWLEVTTPGSDLSVDHISTSPVDLVHSTSQLASGSASPTACCVNGSAGPVNASWDVPQRPRPGRKPATDTPPSKRKAQNRAAQRAFRQRRAARIGELEDEKKQIQEEKARLKTHYEDALSQSLQAVRLQCAEEVAHWRSRAQIAERELAELRQRRLHDVPSAVRLSAAASPRPGDGVSGLLQQSRPASSDPKASPEMGSDCDNCEVNGVCKCLDGLINSGPAMLPPISTSAQGIKSLPAVTDVAMPDRPVLDRFLPVDFTTYRSGSTDFVRSSLNSSQSTPPLTDALPSDGNCGFCTDDRNCICRPDGEDNGRGVRRKSKPNKAVPIYSLVDSSATLSGGQVTPQQMEPRASHAATGPGSCEECMANPEQKRFCQTLARERPISHRPPVSDRGLPASSKESEGKGMTLLSPKSQSRVQDSIPCSEAYKMLKDRHFSMESDTTKWMNTILTLPPVDGDRNPPQDKGSFGHRPTAYEVDCASILAALNAKEQRGSS